MQLWRLTSPKICSWQAGDPEELLMWFWLESRGQTTRRADGLSSSLKAGGLETQEELMFQSESESRKKSMSQIKGSGRRNPSLRVGKSTCSVQLSFN